MVPCYNAQETVSEAIESLLAQTESSSLEIVAVNDGSRDDTLSVLADYAARFPEKVCVVDTPNQGAWRARRAGIDRASGTYVGFLDADDVADPRFVELLHKKALGEDADIVVGGYRRVDESGKELSREFCVQRSSFLVSQQPDQLLTINTAQWNKLYRRDLIADIDLVRAPRVLEDMCFNYLAYLNSEKPITFVPEVLVDYRISEGSAMPTAGMAELEECFDALAEVRSEYAKRASQPLVDALADAAFLHLGISLMFRVSCNDAASVNSACAQTVKYLDDSFPSWRPSSRNSLAKSLKAGGRVPMIWAARTAYRLHAVAPALGAYRALLRVTGKEIKW